MRGRGAPYTPTQSNIFHFGAGCEKSCKFGDIGAPHLGLTLHRLRNLGSTIACFTLETNANILEIDMFWFVLKEESSASQGH